MQEAQETPAASARFCVTSEDAWDSRALNDDGQRWLSGGLCVGVLPRPRRL